MSKAYKVSIDKTSDNIDWEARRYEIAKEILSDRIEFWEKANENDCNENDDEPWGDPYEVGSKDAVIIADFLIAALQDEDIKEISFEKLKARSKK